MLDEIAAATADDDYDIAIGGEQFYTLRGFGKRCHKSEQTIRIWLKKRIGPPCIKLGNEILIPKKEIPGWLRSLQVQPVALIRRGRRERRS